MSEEVIIISTISEATRDQIFAGLVWMGLISPGLIFLFYVLEKIDSKF